jgi:hypothetical protein
MDFIWIPYFYPHPRLKKSTLTELARTFYKVEEITITFRVFLPNDVLWLMYAYFCRRLRKVFLQIQYIIHTTVSQTHSPKVLLNTELHCYMGFEFFTAMILTRKPTIFWDVTPCSIVEVFRRFGRKYYLNLQCRKMACFV